MDIKKEKLKFEEMLICHWILKDDPYWPEWRYKDIYSIESDCREALQILLTEEAVELMWNDSEKLVRLKYNVHFLTHCTASTLSSSEVQCSLGRLCTSVSDRVGQSRDQWNKYPMEHEFKWRLEYNVMLKRNLVESEKNNWNGHRVVCWVVDEMVEKCNSMNERLSDATSHHIMDYLLKLFEFDDLETVKCAILTIEKLVMTMQVGSERRDLLSTALTRHSRQTVSLKWAIDRHFWNAEGYQVGWCARWCLDNVLDRRVGLITMVKLSRDGFEARSDSRFLSPVYSLFHVKSNVYFYEVICVNNGKIKLEWCTRNADFHATKHTLGLSEQSIVLHFGKTRYISHKNKKHHISDLPKLLHPRPFDIIGCLLDVDNRRFEFYLNGQALECPTPAHLSPPYIAIAQLSQHQHCYFNFGQLLFKYPPNIQFKTFNNACKGNAKMFQLAQTFKIYYCHHWSEHQIVDNHVEPYFQDDEQSKYDTMVRQLEYDIVNKKRHKLEIGDIKLARFIQSVIEAMQIELKLCKSWKLLEKWSCSASASEMTQLVEQLYLYAQLLPTKINAIKRINISYIISVMLEATYSFFENWRIKKYPYIPHYQFICKIITPKMLINDCSAVSSEFYEYLERSEYCKSVLLNNPSISCTIYWCAELFSQPISRLSDGDKWRERLGRQARKLLDHINEGKDLPLRGHSTLNPLDKTAHLKLSSDYLTARSEHEQWQSVRSVCSVTSGIYYYEATLVSNGEMRIGWATRQTDWSETKTGDDKFSIGFRGSKQAIIYHRQVGEFVSGAQNQPQWSTGDVVGCLIDYEKKIFDFYLNGQQMQYKNSFTNRNGSVENVHFSNEFYFAAASLSQYQHCHFNFGKMPFKYAPSNLAIKKLHEHSDKTQLLSVTSNPPQLQSIYPLVELLLNETVELVFDDLYQKQFTSVALKIERDIIEGRVVVFELYNDNERLRVIQALIDEVKDEMGDKLDLFARWMDKFILASIDKLLHFPHLVFQVLYPYFSLHLTSSTFTKHRNVCVVLSSLILLLDNLKMRANLCRVLKTYFTQLVTKSDQTKDEWMAMFAIICLENLDLSLQEKNELIWNSKFCAQLESKYRSNSSFQAYLSNIYNLYRQTKFVFRWFHKNVLQSNELIAQNNDATLNLQDKSLHLKLSPCLLTARSDRHWQSVRSSTSYNESVFYYEVTLITNGEMRIGWTPKFKHPTQGKVGDNNHSIAFDGYNQCLWQDGKRIGLEKLPRWKAGDVVCCVIDFDEKLFTFHLNEHFVNCPVSICFCYPVPYFAIMSPSTGSSQLWPITLSISTQSIPELLL